jgi:hypothetical protein
VSNSSSSSFVIGYTGEKIDIKYSDIYNLVELKKIKKECLKNKISCPKEIIDIEDLVGYEIESITTETIMKTEDNTVNMTIAIIEKYDDEVTIDVTKIPERVRYIKVKFEND